MDDYGLIPPDDKDDEIGLGPVPLIIVFVLFAVVVWWVTG